MTDRWMADEKKEMNQKNEKERDDIQMYQMLPSKVEKKSRVG